MCFKDINNGLWSKPSYEIPLSWQVLQFIFLSVAAKIDICVCLSRLKTTYGKVILDICYFHSRSYIFLITIFGKNSSKPKKIFGSCFKYFIFETIDGNGSTSMFEVLECKQISV